MGVGVCSVETSIVNVSLRMGTRERHGRKTDIFRTGKSSEYNILEEYLPIEIQGLRCIMENKMESYS